MDASFGKERIVVNTKSAKGKVRTTPVSTALKVAGLMSRALAARLTGSYADNPFLPARHAHAHPHAARAVQRRTGSRLRRQRVSVHGSPRPGMHPRNSTS
jgi:hypothetical protein